MSPRHGLTQILQIFSEADGEGEHESHEYSRIIDGHTGGGCLTQILQIILGVDGEDEHESHKSSRIIESHPGGAGITEEQEIQQEDRI